MNKLPLTTVRLISSSQVIISLVAVVKELVENSLDSGCDSIDVRLDENGLTKIEVQDNGPGIPSDDIQYVCKQYYTSKLRNEEDLLNLTHYGFRGEALFSICSVSDVSITTKTKADHVSTTYHFSNNGDIIDSKLTHHNVGTIVTVLNLFKTLPVRRQIYKNNRKVKEEVKHIEELLISYAIVLPQLRLTLKYGKTIIWRKDRAANCSLVLSGLFGSNVLNNLQEVENHDDGLKVKAFIPKIDSVANVIGRTLADRMFVLVNKRPVRCKEFKSLLKAYYNEYCCQGKYPFAVLIIEVKPDQLDVNLDPNKIDVLLQNMELVLEKLKMLFNAVYLKNTASNETMTENIAGKGISPVSDIASTQVGISAHLLNNDFQDISDHQDISQDVSNSEKAKVLGQVFSETETQKKVHLLCLNNPTLPHRACQTLVANNNEEKIVTDDSTNFTSVEKFHHVNDDYLCDFEISFSSKNIINSQQKSTKIDCSPQLENGDSFNLNLKKWSIGQHPYGAPASVLKPKTCFEQPKIRNKREKQEATEKQDKAYIKKKKVSEISSKESKELKLTEQIREKTSSINKALKRNRVSANFSTKDLTSACLQRPTDIDQKLTIVGNLPNTCLWIAEWKKQLFCIDKARLSEVLLYKKMHDSHQLTQKKLIHPIKLSLEFLGEKIFQKLVYANNDTESGCVGRYMTNALLSNGFSLRYVKKTTAKEDYFECTHMNDVIPGYGIDDLLQILDKVDVFTVSPTSSIRTDRACLWFKSEATRLSQISSVCSFEEFEMHFNHWSSADDIVWHDRLCFHGRPIVMYVHTADDSTTP